MQNTFFKSIQAKALTLVGLLVLALTFSASAGGDSYEIYLNNKLIMRQFMHEPINIKNLLLDKANANDQIVIYYSHCGQTGKGRSITIKDEKGTTLKEWKYADVSGRHGMSIPVKELLQLQKKNTSPLSLVYTSKELPKGQMLTSVKVDAKSTTYNQAVQKEAFAWRETFTDYILGGHAWRIS
jgi:hypothetical protein